MIPAQQIKSNIEFNKGFHGLLEVLKLVAASEYRSIEKGLQKFESLKDAISQFFSSIDMSGISHPFLNPRGLPMGVVAVTSDVGLLGGMNNKVMAKAMALVHEHQGKLIIIGERGQMLARDAGVPFMYYPALSEVERFRQAAQIRDYLTEKVIARKIGPVTVTYSNAVSLVGNQIISESLLPFKQYEKVKDASASGQTSDSSEKGSSENQTTEREDVFSEKVILESSPMEILEYLVYILMGQRLYEIFGMSRLGEKSARFTHLEDSGHKIEEMNKKLQIQYFRRRHESVDQSMREQYASRRTYAKR